MSKKIEDMPLVNRKIIEIMEQKGCTKRALAHKIGKFPSYIQGINSGRFTPKKDNIIDILVKGFDIPYSAATDLLSEWLATEALSIASEPKKVLENLSNKKSFK